MKNMKQKLVLALLCLAVCLCGVSVAEEISVCGLTVPPDAPLIDFDAAGIQVTDVKALGKAIEQLPLLTEVRMYNSELPKASKEWLFDTYPDVFFGFTLRFAKHEVRTDAEAFSTLHTSDLDYQTDDYDHNQKELRLLRMCTRLKALDIGHNSATDLSFLSGLTELRVLILGPNYYIEDISPLASLTKLEYLELFSTKVRDISALSGMENLRDLNLANSKRLKDLSPIYDLPSLERFWGGMCKFTSAQEKEMEKLHPGCEFDWYNGPTGGTWRLHPRYLIINRMFTTGVYIPFEE